MKKIIYSILTILIGIIPVNVFALSGSTNITCSPSSVNVGEEVTCTVTGTTSGKVSAISATFTPSGSITVSNIAAASIWQGNGDNGNIQLYTDENKTGTFNIITFKVKGNSVGSGTLVIKDVSFIDDNFEENTVSGKTINISVVNKPSPSPSQTTTSSPSASTKPSPSATSTTTPSPSASTKPSPSATTTTTPSPSASTKPSPTATSPTTPSPSASTKPTTSPSPSTTTVPTPSTSEKPTQEEVKLSDVNTLKALTIEEVEINFSSDVTEYNFEVSNDVEKITISAEAEDEKATVTLPQSTELVLGDNKFQIKVKSESGKEKVYTINIKRLEQSTILYLKELDIPGYIVDYNKNTFEYNIGKVKEKSLNIKAIPLDYDVKVNIIGNEDIGEEHTIIIELTNTLGDKTQYKIYASYEEPFDINAYIPGVISILIGGTALIAVIIRNKKLKK